jgi:hypothetical protein
MHLYSSETQEKAAVTIFAGVGTNLNPVCVEQYRSLSPDRRDRFQLLRFK